MSSIGEKIREAEETLSPSAPSEHLPHQREAKEILLQLGQDGEARQVWKTEIYFGSEAERDEFNRKLTEGWCPLEWIDAEVELPVTEETVLCVITGDHGNLRFCGAIEMASWSDQDGWILEAFPDIVNPGVTHWMKLPEGPGEE